MTELLIKDLETVKNRLDKARANAKSGKKDDINEFETVDALNQHVDAGGSAYDYIQDLDNVDSVKILKTLHLLTAKPILIACNVSEEELGNFDVDKVKADVLKNIPNYVEIIPFSAKMEEELVDLDISERKEFLASYNVDSSGLERLIKKSFELLGLQVYYTAGEKEVRAWTIGKGFTAPQAAGVIHTDFEKGFIKAEVCSFDEFIELGGWKGAKEMGKVRLEGKEYIMKEDDVVLFKFNV